MHFRFYYNDVKCLLFSILEELRLGNAFKYSKKTSKNVRRNSKIGHIGACSSFLANFCRVILLKLLTDHTLSVYAAF